MDAVILSMLERYQCKTDNDYENGLKQIMQQIALLGLWRAKFFEHAAFYGGTALRLLYRLDRFSEDLDFSLLNKASNFQLNPYLEAVKQELSAFGFNTTITLKEKKLDTVIQSAFLKANTQQHLIEIQAPERIQSNCHQHKNLKIKLEIDTEPPLGFSTDTVPVLEPIPFWVKSYSLPDLYAGKVCAVLCRQWKNRVKGRDWYDFLWFVQGGVALHLNHLEQRLREFGFYHDRRPLDAQGVQQYLKDKVDQLDVELAKHDISKFIRDPGRLEGWSTALFLRVIDQMRFLV